MGINQRIEDAARDERLPQRYVAMCVETWVRKFGLSADLLGGAMLAHAVNLMIENGGAEEAAAILAGLSLQISTPDVAGYA
jgi:hypothetical protein